MSISGRLHNTAIVKYMRNNREQLDKIADRLEDIKKQNTELLFANIFRDSIQDSSWVKNKSFSPFQAAANYSLLYKLFKIYDIFQPQNVLEFGLGQSTKLSAQYAAAHKEARILAIDDNKEWIKIIGNQLGSVANLNIQYLPVGDLKLGSIKSKAAEYIGLKDVIKKAKYDLIIVDGPVGHRKEYSRTNVLHLVDNLAKDWVVIFDDAERSGEQNTIELFKKQLESHGREYADFEFSALKSQHYFCSKGIAAMIHDI